MSSEIIYNMTPLWRLFCGSCSKYRGERRKCSGYEAEQDAINAIIRGYCVYAMVNNRPGAMKIKDGKPVFDELQ